MSRKGNKIFVQIAAYRDPELLKTLRDCISKAKNPENLVFSLCWQHDENDSLEEFTNDKRFKIIDFDYRDSKGACWARNLLQQQYDNEKYTLQLDSHHRFVQNWDAELISILEELKKKGVKKPLLTGYIPSYNPENDPAERCMEPWKLDFDRFLPEGSIFLKPSTLDNAENYKEPVPARFYGAHFAFADGCFVKEVPHDPEFYFLGEEISIAVRAYTWGYDLFHLNKVLIWHEYGRLKKKRQWDDDPTWLDKDILSHNKNRKLLGIDGEKNDNAFSKYGLGKARTIEQYERYAGIDFKNRRVQKHTYELKLGPPPFESQEDWEANWLKQFRFCIDLDSKIMPEEDYDLWVIAFKNSKGEEICRADVGEEEIKEFKTNLAPDGWYRIWKEFAYTDLPYSYLIWPRSKSKGWLDKIERDIPSPKIRKPKTPDPESLWKDFGKKKYKFKFNKNPDERKILVHLPAYRDPELIPTIEDAMNQAKNPNRLVFGICRQFNAEDKFDNVDKYRSDSRFKIIDMDYTKAKGLAFARYQINTMLEEEEYVLQLDSHHRFTKHWDETLISMHDGLKKKGVKKPLLAGYCPHYSPFNDPEGRCKDPWQTIFGCFYPFGTIFIRPMGLQNWESLTEPIPARFLSGHFSFGDNHWGKTIRHDPDIYFSGEELNLTIRSFTHGYDIYHPHKIVIWHSTMREERNGMLLWDDQFKRGEDWHTAQHQARAKIRQLLRTEDNGFDLTGYDLGGERTLHEYERYAGVCFKDKSVQPYTVEHKFPPNPTMTDAEWKASLVPSYYYLVDVTKEHLPANDYDKILIAFDDEKGEGISHHYVEGEDLQAFTSGKATIHFEEIFASKIKPRRMVFWGHSPVRGWAERVEKIL